MVEVLKTVSLSPILKINAIHKLMTYKITIVTLFPEMFPGALAHSVTGRALKEGIFALNMVNIRDFALNDVHKTVDATPYGGGAGMLLRADVVAGAVRKAKEAQPKAKVVFMTPVGKQLTQEDSHRLAAHKGGLILLCGHYEGIDQRVIEKEVDEEISIGDYVLSGGELAAMVLTDAVVRHHKGVLGSAESLEEESFDIKDDKGAPLLEYPHYTRPETWEGKTVPEVLKSGHHGKIKAWRMAQSKKRTEHRKKRLP